MIKRKPFAVVLLLGGFAAASYLDGDVWWYWCWYAGAAFGLAFLEWLGTENSMDKQMPDGKMNGWRSLKDDPPPQDMRSFFVGHARGGRLDYVFRWPHAGKMQFWCYGGGRGNYVLTGYTPDIWYPGPPTIPSQPRRTQ